MSDDEVIAALIKTIGKFPIGTVLKNYITFAQFPRFKGLEPGTRVDFKFPLTALVGANGSGKSSLLHALWGMPFGYSTAKFWFSTDLDPIAESKVDPQRYFYGHWNESFKGEVETRKARIGKRRGYDYWEPYRWSSADGMRVKPTGKFAGRSKDRWNPVRRNVVYINFKATFGSFDRYFYFDDASGGASAKTAAMLNEARRLKVIRDKDLRSYKLAGKERVFENRVLAEDEVKQISRILGRDYESARIIRHSLYLGNRAQDLSVIFQRGLLYSEAFAGSGEVAAVSAVVQVLAAEPYSLILLDEPETSLHPGAQRALLRFLLEQIKEKKHQIVLSTHSGEFLSGLPHEAIKVFEDNGKMQTRILPKSSPFAALRRLGKPAENKRRVLVEDQLAAIILEQAVKGIDEGDAANLEIRVAPGGAEALLKYVAPAAMLSSDRIFIFLDGDKKMKDEFSDPETIAPAQYASLDELLKTEVGFNPLLHIPGGADAAGHKQAKIDAQLAYLAWLRKHVAYLPRHVPEHIVLEALDPENEHYKKSAAAAKKTLRDFVGEGLDVQWTGPEYLGMLKFKIAQIPNDNADLTAIRDQLSVWIHS
ncbi:putative ATPase [Pseudacidovorax sp. 1753]|uniref:ATP-dependent nuclease n=1 Tax=Pseudacidovorax sp. 1753 TaxID=3156419 RepID=UPI003390852D